MTNLALALSLDPQFAELSKGLVFMGGSINPQTDNPEFATNPRHEFNLWFDPEASHIVLRAHWPSIVCTTVDVSVKTQLSEQMMKEISQTQTPVAKYLTYFARPGRSYLWDELAAAAWLDPSLITAERKVYMDVSLDRGAGYGDTLIWSDRVKPALDVQLVHAQMDVNMPRFAEMFVKLMTGPTPGAHDPLMLKEPPPPVAAPGRGTKYRHAFPLAPYASPARGQRRGRRSRSRRGTCRALRRYLPADLGVSGTRLP
jgi:inosine-uridine nucleoside N-ribohydrolase